MQTSSFWISFCVSLLLASFGGTGYGFGIYSRSLNEIGFSDRQVGLIGSFGNAGLYSSIIMGTVLDRYGPRRGAIIGCIFSILGWSTIWMTVNRTLPPAFIILCIASFVSQLSSSMMSVLSVAVPIRNFSSTNRGQVVGLSKGLFALSSSAFALFNKGFFKDQASVFLSFLTISCSAVLCLAIFKCRIIQHQSSFNQDHRAALTKMSVLAAVVATSIALSTFFGTMFTGNISFTIGALCCSSLFLAFFGYVIVQRDQTQQYEQVEQEVMEVEMVDGDDGDGNGEGSQHSKNSKKSDSNINLNIVTSDYQVVPSSEPTGRGGSKQLSPTINSINSPMSPAIGLVSEVPRANDVLSPLQGDAWKGVPAEATGPLNVNIGSSSSSAVNPNLQPENNVDIVSDDTTLDENVFQVIRSGIGWILWLNFFVGAGGGLLFINKIATLADTLHHGVKLSTSIYVMCIGLGNFLGRVICGEVMDRLKHYAPKPTYLLCLNVVMAITNAAFAFAPSSEHSTNLFLIFFSFVGAFCYGGVFSTSAILMSEYFGPRYFGQNYGFLGLAAAASSFLIPSALFGELFEEAKEDDCEGSECFRSTFLIVAGLNVACIFLCWLLQTGRVRKRPCPTSKQ